MTAESTQPAAAVNPDRVTVARDDEFVVFLIGARVNRWWLLPVIWGVSMAMSRMMRELKEDPESGLMSYESYGGRTTLMVQYWRSVDDLMNYAKAKEKAHVPAWRRWLQEWGLGGVMGIWHETYVVGPGAYECVYQHMPPFGLARAGRVVPATGKLRTARGRLSALDPAPSERRAVA